MVSKNFCKNLAVNIVIGREFYMSQWGDELHLFTAAVQIQQNLRSALHLIFMCFSST